jgi:hypothetical protein
MNASKVIKDLSELSTDIIREVLLNLQKCKIDAKTKNNILIVRIYLFSKRKEITSVITLPSITETSPSLAYA